MNVNLSIAELETIYASLLSRRNSLKNSIAFFVKRQDFDVANTGNNELAKVNDLLFTIANILNKAI